jgi:hypothetical protein
MPVISVLLAASCCFQYNRDGHEDTSSTDVALDSINVLDDE